MKDPRRVAVVVTRQIGDVLLTTPLIAAAAARWPHASIDVVGFAGTLGMLEGNRHVARCIELPSRPGWRDVWRFLGAHVRHHDLVLIAEPSDRAHLIGFLLGGTRTGLVPSTASHAWWKRRLLDHAVTIAGDRGDRHVADEKLALLSPWCGGDEPAPRPVPPADAALPEDLHAEHASTVATVVVHAPSMWTYKQWPVERYGDVVAALLGDGHRIVLTGSAAPRDRAIVDAVLARAVPRDGRGFASAGLRLVDAAGRLDFRQLSALLRRAALYIGPDGSVTHLAAACGTPTIAMFGPTDPRRWGPVAGPERFVRIAASPQRVGAVTLLQGFSAGCCVPCGRAGCDDRRDSRSACLEAIGVEQVLAEARRLLECRKLTGQGPAAIVPATSPPLT